MGLKKDSGHSYKGCMRHTKYTFKELVTTASIHRRTELKVEGRDKMQDHGAEKGQVSNSPHKTELGDKGCQG